MTARKVRTLRFVLGDQLSHRISSLRDIDVDHDVVLLAEVQGECSYAPHHKKKIVFVLSAMRHFAEDLRAEGLNVDYRTLDTTGDEGSFGSVLADAASGKYIRRMSDYCRSCRYDVNEATGPDACPFNFLYWSFLGEYRAKLAANPRMALIYRTLDRMPTDRVAAMKKQAERFLDRIC